MINEAAPPKVRQLFRSSFRERSGERGCGDAHKRRVGVDTRSGAGLAQGGPCGDPQHGDSWGNRAVLHLQAKRRAAPCLQAVAGPLARPLWADSAMPG